MKNFKVSTGAPPATPPQTKPTPSLCLTATGITTDNDTVIPQAVALRAGVVGGSSTDTAYVIGLGSALALDTDTDSADGMAISMGIAIGSDIGSGMHSVGACGGGSVGAGIGGMVRVDCFTWNIAA